MKKLQEKKDLFHLHKNIGIVFQEAENQIIASTVEGEVSFGPKNVDLLEDTLNELSNRGITLLISTHDVDFAYKFADRVVVFSEGTIIVDENVDTLFQRDDIIEQAGIKKTFYTKLYNA